MATTSVYLPDLRYDPNESFADFCSRRQHALSEGRLAVRERRISGDLYLFYEHLVERVGANQYTWIGEDTLADTFRVDPSTIKRRIARLVRAGLIRRQRQFATSSRTYITAYDRTGVLLDTPASKPDTTGADLPDTEAAASTTQGAEAAPSDSSAEQVSDPEAVSVWRRAAPTFGADLPRDLIKRPHLNPGGGTESSRSLSPVAPEIRLLLEREGVTTFYLAPQLHQTPAEELHAVSRYLDRQPNVRDRARLFAALATRGFGALLLAGRGEHPRRAMRPSRRAAPAPSRTDDPRKYVSGALAPFIMGGGTDHPDAALAPDARPSGGEQIQPPTAVLEQTWQQVLGSLQQVLPASEVATWFTDAALLALDGTRAVVGVPNIFAREQLMRCYQAQIAQALASRCGHPIEVQIEIGGP